MLSKTTSRFRISYKKMGENLKNVLQFKILMVNFEYFV